MLRRLNHSLVASTLAMWTVSVWQLAVETALQQQWACVCALDLHFRPSLTRSSVRMGRFEILWNWETGCAWQP